ncbi:MAG: DUF1800 domain-containing protein [Solirubrobacterales bacterium]
MAVVYTGTFGRTQAERLLWRAGLGPRPGEVSTLVERGLAASVDALVSPTTPTTLEGAAPRLDGGRRLDPESTRGHEQLWWLDRMVRVNNPFRERMTLIWHDWFATSNVGVNDQRLMLQQNRTIRRLAIATFPELLREMTRDPAMLVWLSGNKNVKDAPNENYGREMMELFTLGANARFSEADVREQSRALTGWASKWDSTGYTDFFFDQQRHDSGLKTVFGKRGYFDWADSCQMCVEHPDHPRFFVRKLWSYFIPSAPSPTTLAVLMATYRDSGFAIEPVVRGILLHPDMYSSARMPKSPILYLAGLMRLRRATIDGSGLATVMRDAGQTLFHPPNVDGWDDLAWLNTSTFRGRWMAARSVCARDTLNPHDPAVQAACDPTESAQTAVALALAYWGSPTIGAATRGELVAFAQRCQDKATGDWARVYYRIMRANALRLLIATSPEFQTC